MAALRENLFSYAKADAVVLASAASMRALCGYTGEGYVVAFENGDVTIVTDSRYTIAAKQEVPYADIDTLAGGQTHASRIASALKMHKAKMLAFEDETWTVAEFEQLRASCPDVLMIPLGDSLVRWRMEKYDWEIDRIRRAAKIADEAFCDVLQFMALGMTEREAAWRLEQAMRNRGAEGLAFDTIIAAGENGAKPHAVPGERTLQMGDLVVMDFGCKVDGYCCDMTRTVAMGKVGDLQKKIYDIVLCAQETACKALCAGKTGTQVDQVARDIIASHGYDAYFGHGLGHGVGLEIHELPRLTKTAAGGIELKAGHVVSVEPGIYLPDQFGVRIEDLCLVKETGCEILSHSPKNLIVL